MSTYEFVVYMAVLAVIAPVVLKAALPSILSEIRKHRDLASGTIRSDA